MLLLLTCLRADISPKYFKGWSGNLYFSIKSLWERKSYCSFTKSFTFEIPREKRFFIEDGLVFYPSELCHIGCSRNCCLVFITSSKLTSDNTMYF